MEKHIYKLPIRVLLKEEDGEFVAHALEFDLLGYGSTHAEALKNLDDMIRMQITFASQQKKSEMVVHPAPKEFFDCWEKAHQAALRNQITPARSLGFNFEATCIFLDRADQPAVSRTNRFRRITGDCLAASSKA